MKHAFFQKSKRETRSGYLLCHPPICHLVLLTLAPRISCIESCIITLLLQHLPIMEEALSATV